MASTETVLDVEADAGRPVGSDWVKLKAQGTLGGGSLVATWAAVC